MLRRILAALAALIVLLCLPGCQGTQAAPSSSSQAVPEEPAAPAVQEMKAYRLSPVQEGEEIYQVTSAQDEEGRYQLVPAADGPYKVVMVSDPRGVWTYEVVPALDGTGLYEVAEAEEDTLYRVQTSPSSETVMVVDVPAPALPVLTQEDVDEALERAAEDFPVISIAAAAVENGRLSQSGAWGWAVKDQREMTPDTKVRVASLTKVAVGMCAMALEEDGLLDLDAPLSDYWGEGVTNPYAEREPTVRTLMSHSSSLRTLDFAWGLSRLRGILSRASAWRSVEPGNGGYWHYNNFAYGILGTTLELAADRTLDGYLHERFLDPLGASGSLFGGNLEAEEMACLYNSWGGVEQSPEFQAGQAVPGDIGDGASYYAGGLTISAVDMAKLVAVLAGDGAYEGEQILAPETVAEMETPQFLVDQGDTYPFQQCLTLRRQEDIYGQSVLCYHTGSAYGVFNLLSYNPDTGDGVVVLTVGTPRRTDDRGLYALCAQVSEELYVKMEGDA